MQERLFVLVILCSNRLLRSCCRQGNTLVVVVHMLLRRSHRIVLRSRLLRSRSFLVLVRLVCTFLVVARRRSRLNSDLRR